jgi:hypothetical protein
MGRKRSGGFIFVTYKGDHPPFHVHIEKGGREIGRWDIENQKPMDNLKIGQKLKNALRKTGYLFTGE